MSRQEESQLSEIGKRIHLIMRRYSLSHQEFTKIIESNNTTVSNMVSGRNYTLASLKQVLDTFPDVNVSWLLFGEGEPFAQGLIQDTLYKELKTLQNELEMIKSRHAEITTGKPFEAMKDEIIRLIEKTLDHRGKLVGWLLDRQISIMKSLN